MFNNFGTLQFYICFAGCFISIHLYGVCTKLVLILIFVIRRMQKFRERIGNNVQQFWYFTILHMLCWMFYINTFVWCLYETCFDFNFCDKTNAEISRKNTKQYFKQQYSTILMLSILLIRCFGWML